MVWFPRREQRDRRFPHVTMRLQSGDGSRPHPIPPSSPLQPSSRRRLPSTFLLTTPPVQCSMPTGASHPCPQRAATSHRWQQGGSLQSHRRWRWRGSHQGHRQRRGGETAALAWARTRGGSICGRGPLAAVRRRGPTRLMAVWCARVLSDVAETRRCGPARAAAP